jgi:hypothetical protein
MEVTPSGKQSSCFATCRPILRQCEQLVGSLFAPLAKIVKPVFWLAGRSKLRSILSDDRKKQIPRLLWLWFDG